MKARSFSGWVRGVVMGVVLTGVVFSAMADSIEMRNGDRYVGTVVAIDAKHLTLTNENLGTFRIDRQKISTVRLGQPAAPAAATTSPTNAIVAAMPVKGVSTADQAMIDQVRAQFLSAAGPEANALFDATVQSVMGGRLTVGDIRAQAQTAANELRKFQKELGEEGAALDGYLGVLEGFLSKTRAVAPATKASELAR